MPFDFDSDGDLDLVIGDNLGPLKLFENQLDSASRHWLTVEAEGSVSNRNGVGARVYITAGGSFYAGLPLEAHFGLGPATLVEKVLVTFPSGITVVQSSVAADQRIRVTESGSMTGRRSFR